MSDTVDSALKVSVTFVLFALVLVISSLIAYGLGMLVATAPGTVVSVASGAILFVCVMAGVWAVMRTEP